MESNQIIVPFLKWAGGKRWLTSAHPDLFPSNYRTYVEPFLGSGAMYFFLKPKSAVLNDVNAELVGCYRAIRKNWQRVYEYLEKHQKSHSSDYYYKIRDAQFRGEYQRAARFIYLNRTCWNGLYRVNKCGEFNVPIGTKTQVLLRSDNFEATSRLLAGADITSFGYKTIVQKTKAGDFLYVDPPYTVKHNLNGFIKYNENLFSWDDQVELAKLLISASKRGVNILISNAAHPSISELYTGHFDIYEVERSSVIAGSAQKRGSFTEFLIRNYD